MKRLLPFVLIAAAAGCGGVTSSDPDASSEPTADADPNAPDADPNAPDADPSAPDASRGFGADAITRDCAPNDGPAVRITIADSIGPSCWPDDFGPSIEIVLWVHPITAPQTVVFNNTEKNGSATHCLGGAAPCLFATSGTIEFDAYADGVGARGSYTLQFGDGEPESGDFDASWCTPPDPILCG